MVLPGSGCDGPLMVTGASLPSARTRNSRLPSAGAPPLAGLVRIRAPAV
ncbi:MAG: hypothetical protein WBQ71_18005 [Trebonia sp.]